MEWFTCDHWAIRVKLLLWLMNDEWTNLQYSNRLTFDPGLLDGQQQDSAVNRFLSRQRQSLVQRQPSFLHSTDGNRRPRCNSIIKKIQYNRWEVVSQETHSQYRRTISEHISCNLPHTEYRKMSCLIGAGAFLQPSHFSSTTLTFSL